MLINQRHDLCARLTSIPADIHGFVCCCIAAQKFALGDSVCVMCEVGMSAQVRARPMPRTANLVGSEQRFFVPFLARVHEA
jgi:hypothetical protein